MSLLENLIWFYLAMVATVIVHEIGHQGKQIKIARWFPWVEGASMEAKYRYGGLIVNFVLGYLIFTIKPENIFLQLFGLLNWLHFSLYSIFGSFNYEPNIAPRFWRYWVFDDVPNEKAILFVSFGIINFLLFKTYYLGVLVSLLGIR